MMSTNSNETKTNQTINIDDIKVRCEITELLTKENLHELLGKNITIGDKKYKVLQMEKGELLSAGKEAYIFIRLRLYNENENIEIIEIAYDFGKRESLYDIKNMWRISVAAYDTTETYSKAYTIWAKSNFWVIRDIIRNSI